MIRYDAETGELTLPAGSKDENTTDITLSPHASRVFKRWLHAGDKMDKKVLADKAEFALEYSAGIRVLTEDGTWRLRDRDLFGLLLKKMSEVMFARGGMSLVLLRCGPVSALWGPTTIEDDLVTVHARHGARVSEQSVSSAIYRALDPSVYVMGEQLHARVDVPLSNIQMIIWERY